MWEGYLDEGSCKNLRQGRRGKGRMTEVGQVVIKRVPNTLRGVKSEGPRLE